MSANLARRLSDYFGSLATIVAASDAELRKVQGMGPKRIEMIREVLHGAAGD
ncbi:helix-hairpin-helix domain-containing protein [Halomonas sp. I5-271120]|uniref:helix-hairpin-helix domain-containing protein n=1 Tax=Halomonas sp. I5-271120 TaxID=3061632 RepID=UPI0027E619A5